VTAHREYNFTGGMPDPASFPIEGLVKSAVRALRRVGGDGFVRYPGDHGDLNLREVAAVRFLRSHGASVSPSDIAITNGSMQAIDLICRAYVRPGDIVVTEELAYVGTLGALRHYGTNMVGIPVDKDGMDVEVLERRLAEIRDNGGRPAFIYTIPVNQNPTGAQLSVERKARLIELAEEFETLIVEDECYGDIFFEATGSLAMYATATPGRVAYLGTFSKTIGPGMRLGYVIAPQATMLRILAQRYDGGTSTFASVILADYLRDNMWEHIAETNDVVRRKRDVLLESLRAELSDLARCRRPTGGLFAWIGLPASINMDRLMASFSACGVMCTRGRDFHVDSKDVSYVRFSYAYPTHDDIREGVRLFGDCVRAA